MVIIFGFATFDNLELTPYLLILVILGMACHGMPEFWNYGIPANRHLS